MMISGKIVRQLTRRPLGNKLGGTMPYTDHELMEIAVRESEKCKGEDARIHPKVGIVVSKDGEIIATGYRGEISVGDHGEFTVLEKKLGDKSLIGATLFTTLEPCVTRNHPKIPCAERIIERKISRVVIGMLDPNPNISGRGQRRLREANIATDLFTIDLMQRVEELNREFIRHHKIPQDKKDVDPAFIEQAKKRSLDQWYRSINEIYWNKNYYRDRSAIFAHLVEVVGGLSLLASSKKKIGVNPETFVPKVLAWWLSLCGHLHIKSVEMLIWTKFPGICPYCLERVHNQSRCGEMKKANRSPNWHLLYEHAINEKRNIPKSLGGWQCMFNSIYPAQQTEDFGPSFARLTEELGELAEAVRTFDAAPSFFISEASDVFAWLMHVQNILDIKNEVPYEIMGQGIDAKFAMTYPDYCTDCGAENCICPPVLPETIGRLAHEVPEMPDIFLPLDTAFILFQSSIMSHN
jgi:pyrimidine deaminase RibD-like protein/NTP pyrophosphatase (non-canonical NTP hydrolase)